jgi:hypothetical protein
MWSIIGRASPNHLFNLDNHGPERRSAQVRPVLASAIMEPIGQMALTPVILEERSPPDTPGPTSGPLPSTSRGPRLALLRAGRLPHRHPRRFAPRPLSARRRHQPAPASHRSERLTIASTTADDRELPRRRPRLVATAAWAIILSLVAPKEAVAQDTGSGWNELESKEGCGDSGVELDWVSGGKALQVASGFATTHLEVVWSRYTGTGWTEVGTTQTLVRGYSLAIDTPVVVANGVEPGQVFLVVAVVRLWENDRAVGVWLSTVARLEVTEASNLIPVIADTRGPFDDIVGLPADLKELEFSWSQTGVSARDAELAAPGEFVFVDDRALDINGVTAPVRNVDQKGSDYVVPVEYK